MIVVVVLSIDSVNDECTIIIQPLYSVTYYRLILSRLDGVQNPMGMV